MDNDAPFGPWNPGLQSEIPTRLMPLVTLYRPENGEVSYEQAVELRDTFGLPLELLATFTPERLIIHRLLVRITADFTLKDGPAYEDLGISLRGMVERLFAEHVKPKLGDFTAQYEQVRSDAARIIDVELAGKFGHPAPSEVEKKPRELFKLFAPKDKQPPRVSEEERQLNALNDWQSLQTTETDGLKKACLAALHRVVGSHIGQRGRIVAEHDLIRDVCVRLVLNQYGADEINHTLDPLIDEAARREQYRVLPNQKEPVIFNVKGASASGKSTIRGEQRRMAERLGVPWEDFALISPDYWRKYLLEYESLGDDYKYGAMLTGRELEIIDRKLDHYMSEKARARGISHLLIDRFRFDSFSTNPVDEASSRLLTRFGHTIYLFFMVTPPDALVERAWGRGLTTGRYKAVDDLLYHNIEAYTGMPNLFFSWVQSKAKAVHFEFLDNSVKKGTKPKTVALGWNDEMIVYDIEALLQIARFQDINIEAGSPDEIFEDQKSDNDAAFLESCVERLSKVRFIEPKSGECYAYTHEGAICLAKGDRHAKQKQAIKSALNDSALNVVDGEGEAQTFDPDKERLCSVGAWG
ncbi:MAG: hypothetical protein ABJN04_03740 [Hyphomicrobiales bacterium]